MKYHSIFGPLSIATASAALLLTAPAAADPAEVTINITVEQIAILTVIEGSGTKIIDAPPANGGVFMLPESAAMNATNISQADIPVVQLETNFPISSMLMDFPRRNGFNRGCNPNNPGATFFGEAVRVGGDSSVDEDVLGVWPQMARVRIADGELLGRTGHNCNNNPLSFTNAAPYGNGVHQFALGVSARWDNTLQTSSNLFAAPGVYAIELSLTMVP